MEAMVVLIAALGGVGGCGQGDGAVELREKASQRVGLSRPQLVLEDGYYLRKEFVDQASQTYSLAKYWDSPPIFSEFKVSRTRDGYELEGGNLRESLVEFAVDRIGKVTGRACFEDFCVENLGILSNESFEIVVKGRTQFFVSTKRLERAETPDESGPPS